MPPVECDPAFPYAYALTLAGAAILAAVVGWLGNFHVQSWLHRRVQRIDRLRGELYHHLSLASDYWYGAIDPEKRGITECRLIVLQQIIVLEYSLLSRKHRKVQASFKDSQGARLRLWDSVTGGCFQSARWSPCPERARAAARATIEIVRSLEF